MMSQKKLMTMAAPLLALSLLLAGCGQKGPLYHPDNRSGNESFEEKSFEDESLEEDLENDSEASE